MIDDSRDKHGVRPQFFVWKRFLQFLAHSTERLIISQKPTLRRLAQT